MTGGVMELLSMFKTLSVEFLSKASTNLRATLSDKSVLAKDNTSNRVLVANASNNRTNFSSEIF
jgi:hypothetical protein